MTQGRLIQTTRKRKGMTQVQLGAKLGVTSAMISQWENDIRKPKKENIERLAEALECTVFDLLPNMLHNSLKYALQRPKNDSQYLRMLLSYERLNNVGKQLVIKYAEELAGMGNYAPAKTTADLILTTMVCPPLQQEK